MTKAEELMAALTALVEADHERLREAWVWISATEPELADRIEANLRYLAGGPVPEHLRHELVEGDNA